MALTSYDLLFAECGGGMQGPNKWYGTRVIAIPTNALQAELDNLEPGTGNKWPGTSGIYAPCISDYSYIPCPGRPEDYKVTIHYSWPDLRTILSPGRGELLWRSYAETRPTLEMVAARAYDPVSGDTRMYLPKFVKGRKRKDYPKLMYRLVCVTYASELTKWNDKAKDWIGKVNRSSLDNMGFAAEEIKYMGSNPEFIPGNAGRVFWTHLLDYDPDKHSYEQRLETVVANQKNRTPQVQEIDGGIRKGSTARGKADMSELDSFLSWKTS